MKPNPKLFDGIRIRTRPHGTTQAANANARPSAPCCQWDGCEEPATHRAPVGRMREGEYFRFCLDHVREYNKSYNYFSGLTDGDIARFQKEAITGHRPTWKIGTAPGATASPDMATARSGSARSFRMRDPGAARPPEFNPTRRRLKALEAKALETLHLPPTAEPDAIRARYKELVKKHHPDANGGDRGSEDRFREVVQAYRLLKQAGFC